MLQSWYAIQVSTQEHWHFIWSGRLHRVVPEATRQKILINPIEPLKQSPDLPLPFNNLQVGSLTMQFRVDAGGHCFRIQRELQEFLDQVRRLNRVLNQVNMIAIEHLKV